MEPEKTIQKFEKHLENTRSIIHYSMERIDILIISISTASLGFSMAFIKDIIPDLVLICLTLLKISWICFGISIVSNLVSQVTSYYANKYEYKITRNIIREKEGKEMKGDQEDFKCYQKAYNISTAILNNLSIISLISGIITFIVFVNQNI